jgi:hypothetical protein
MPADANRAPQRRTRSRSMVFGREREVVDLVAEQLHWDR